MEKQQFTEELTTPLRYTQNKVEVWDFIVDNQLSYLVGNAVKYVFRHKYKGGLQDLAKARFYLEKALSSAEQVVKNHKGIRTSHSVYPIDGEHFPALTVFELKFLDCAVLTVVEDVDLFKEAVRLGLEWLARIERTYEEVEYE